VRICTGAGQGGHGIIALYCEVRFWILILLVPISTIPRELAREVYVWQRAWNSAVRTSVAEKGEQFEKVVVLAAEVSWKESRLEWVSVPVDFTLLKRGPFAAGMAIRINKIPLPLDQKSVANLIGGVEDLLREARSQGFSPAEMQLDFDSPEARLGDYKEILQMARKAVNPIPLSITALPSWLNAPEFPGLLAAVDSFVLQVHSLRGPKRLEAEYTLCDPIEAKRAVAKASLAGKRFRIALPTYGYLLAFDKAGNYLGLSAEGPLPEWPAGTQLRTVRAEPAAMVSLVQEWKMHPPANCTGLIWYRLPISSDQLNWSWQTFVSVMNGRNPIAKIETVLRQPQPRLVEIALRNSGDLDAQFPGELVVKSSGAKFIAGDALIGYTAEEAAPNKWVLSRGQPDQIRPDETRVVGWIRLDQDAKVEVEITRP
jgi:hypothetical protein